MANYLATGGPGLAANMIKNLLPAAFQAYAELPKIHGHMNNADMLYIKALFYNINEYFINILLCHYKLKCYIIGLTE